MTKRLYLVPLFLVLVLGACAPVKSTSQSCTPSPSLAREVFDAVNKDRVAKGLPAVTWSQPAADFATYWSTRMATDAGFRHSTPAEQGSAGPPRWTENIIRAWPACLPAANIEDVFMDSFGHRQTILHPFMRTLGVGWYTNGTWLFLAQEFGV